MSISILLKCIAALALASAGVAQAAKPTPLSIADSHTYSLVVNATSRTPTTNTIEAQGATFMTVHFASFNLAAGDKVVVRDVEGFTKYEYTGLGRANLGNSTSGFYSSMIPGDQVIVEFQPSSESVTGAYGFNIDKITRSSNTGSASTICGTDQSRPAKCYVNDTALSSAYGKAQAAARLFIVGGTPCSGWLVGSQGHLLTNAHCISTAEQASQTDYELGAESSSCEEECQLRGGCKGTIVATSAQLVAVDTNIDYALVKLDTTADLSGYGYLTMRVSGPVQNEQIYIPQHPSGWAKRIAAVDDDGNVTVANKVGQPLGCGTFHVGYTADTQGGSSGSPVLAASDNNVIALHACGGLTEVCENSGIDIRTVIWDLKNKGITLPDDALTDPTATIPPGTWTPDFSATPAPTAAPTPAVPSTLCRVFRQASTCAISGTVCAWVNGACIPNPVTTTPTPSPTPNAGQE
ncbi:hypothetical protein FI667_g8518, partial [Globisporangium splendens]